MSVAFGTKPDMHSKEQRATFDKKLDDFFDFPPLVKYLGMKVFFATKSEKDHTLEH